MTEKHRGAFQDALGIGDIETVFGAAERAFLQWETRRRGSGHEATKESLLADLGTDFLALLDAVTIARSRDHIHRYYPQVEERVGGFPLRAEPENLHPPTDSEGKLSYDDLHGRISTLRLAVYTPAEYLKDGSELEEERKVHGFDQRTREHYLTAMLRVNLLKRLESSAHAFTLTIGRILDKIGDVERRIDTWRTSADKAKAEAAANSDPEHGDEDEEFAVGNRRRYQLSELDVARWREDLTEDRRVFDRLHALGTQVTPARDAKLTALKRVLSSKATTPSTDKDGRLNRKTLVFTTFADTARYLYDNLEEWARRDLGVHIALATGGDGNQATVCPSRFEDILGHFAPRAQQWPDVTEEVDILIATDCLSEGQNLQDCDLTVNYDIHWNPVRLMQRFGRVDRLGSRNKQVGMVNFWPTENLDRYLDLKNRVEARMALADATATGLDDPFDTHDKATPADKVVQRELQFRDEQLRRLRTESLNIEAADDSVSMNDFTLDDFIADLLNYIQQHRQALEAAPFGIYAIVDIGQRPGRSLSADTVRPGVIFCLKQKATAARRTPNRLQPYFLAYVRSDGTVRYTFRQAKQTLSLFQTLASGATEAVDALEDAFDRETAHGREMEKYEKLLTAAVRSISRTFGQTQQQALGRSRNAVLAKASEQPNDEADFELVTWLVLGAAS